ncbi:MAG: ATP-binding cassette domain-containing protein [Alphaproteobacteria bacterium]|jgi:phosphonate transport system ATP-binding protein|nr:ATP-binding cassette domain-containing protein [Alphaproteobacteria bacterium]
MPSIDGTIETASADSSAEVISRGLKGNECALRVKSLSLTFANGLKLFDRIDFSVDEGERVAIIGRNGAGKSTLLRAALGMIPLSKSEGEWLYGEPMHNISGRKRRRLLCQVGFIHQRHNLVPRATALTNVMHGSMVRYRPSFRVWNHAVAPAHLRDEAMELLERVGLADRALNRASALSGGQSQRVAIARALMQRPKLVIADEPVASLDPVAGEEVMELFSRLVAEQNSTLIFVSHHLPHAVSYADRILGVRDGRIDLDCAADAKSIEELGNIYGDDDDDEDED